MAILPLIASAIKRAGRLNMGPLHINWMKKVEENIDAADTQFTVVDTEITALQDYINTTVAAALAPLPPFIPMALSFTATSNGTDLTITLKNKSGGDISAANPVQVPFRSATATSAVPDILSITSPISITTSTGASFGTTANIAFKLWVLLFNNNGTPVLGLYQTVSNANNVAATNLLGMFTIPIDQLVSTTAISASATSAGVFYTNGASLASKAFRVLGYVEYGSGLATAGNFVSSPTESVLFGPGVKLPGEVIQTQMRLMVNRTSVTSATFVAIDAGATLTPLKSSSMLRISSDFTIIAGVNLSNGFARLFRNSSTQPAFAGSTNTVMGASQNQYCYNSIRAYEIANTLSALTYVLMISNPANLGTYQVGGTGTQDKGFTCIEEIMT